MRLLAEDVVAERTVGVMMPAFSDTQRAFDGVAGSYHQSNEENRMLREMRARVRETLCDLAPDGSHILDLGCGPGTDAAWLAGRGYRVTAIDASSAMVDEARRRVSDAGMARRVDVLNIGIHEIDRLAAMEAAFDAALSNFGPLNCVDDLPAAALRIADRLKPGGVLVASVIGRICPWEIARYASHGEWRRASVRFRRGSIPVPLDGRTVWTRYIHPREFQAIFAAAGLTRISLRALGLFVPPPYMQAFSDRHPDLIDGLQWTEDRCAHWPLLRGWGDHFLIALRKA